MTARLLHSEKNIRFFLQLISESMYPRLSDVNCSCRSCHICLPSRRPYHSVLRETTKVCRRMLERMDQHHQISSVFVPPVGHARVYAQLVKYITDAVPVWVMYRGVVHLFWIQQREEKCAEGYG